MHYLLGWCTSCSGKRQSRAETSAPPEVSSFCVNLCNLWENIRSKWFCVIRGFCGRTHAKGQKKRTTRITRTGLSKNNVNQNTTVDNSNSQSGDVTVDAPQPVTPKAEPVYKVYVGTYTSAEQAKVAKEIIQESGNGLNPIVKCIGSNNYTLQVGLFKSKQSAESLLYTVQQNHLPGRVVQEY